MKKLTGWGKGRRPFTPKEYARSYLGTDKEDKMNYKEYRYYYDNVIFK